MVKQDPKDRTSCPVTGSKHYISRKLPLFEVASHRLQQWLDDVAERDGPAAALAIYVKMLEFAVPKLARQELIGDAAEPQELIVRWLPSTS